METQREKHVTVKLKDISNLKPQSNYVVCKRLYDNIHDTTNGGVIKATDIYNRDQYIVQNSERVFEIVSIPDKLEEQIGFWKTDIEIKVGDIAFVQYHESLNAKVIKTEDEEYRFILYYGIIAVKREDKIIPINGYTLFTRVPIEFQTQLIIPDKAKIPDPRYGIIEYISKPNKYHIKDKKQDSEKGVDISVGDKVIFIEPIERSAPILEYPLHRKLDKEYYYCQRHRIGGKFI